MCVLFFVLLVSFVFADQQRVQAAYGPGAPLFFVWQSYLAQINQERQFWNIPPLSYDNDLATIAQYTCSQCAWSDIRPESERQQMLCDLKGLPYGDPNVAIYQTVGENRASASGALGDPNPSLWLHRSDWNCTTNGCAATTTCADYTQLIWNITGYVGCGKCACNISNPIPSDGIDWHYFVCEFAQAGNSTTGQHPFGTGAVQAEACAHTYTPSNPTQPPACSTLNCTNPTSCPSPLSTAICNTTTGHWQAGSVKASDFQSNIYLNCNLDLTSITATSSDILRITQCGQISVSGSSKFSGNPTVYLDFQDVTGLNPQFYQPFFITSSQITGGGVWGSAIARNVWSASTPLCAEAITGTKTSYVLLFDCVGDWNPDVVTPLPDGGAMLSGGQSPPTTGSRTKVPGAGGDINDPELQTLPKKSIVPTPVPVPAPVPATPQTPTTPSSPQTPTPTSSPSGSSGLAINGWVIFLVCLVGLGRW